MPEETGPLGLPRIPPRKWLVGERAEEFATAVARAYKHRGASIRDIAEESGRSYGAIHRLLSQQKVTLRPSGGGNHSSTQKKGHK
ncbi:helix-turn-helix domain-containing protein [Streptomyces sp. NPDC050617]|uniref:helix-turn-helix domain-containing protein n=1 Tax=Streptomyces sp. NPDC050617 TaxID=3154628 RepID=UPI00342A8309